MAWLILRLVPAQRAAPVPRAGRTALVTGKEPMLSPEEISTYMRNLARLHPLYAGDSVAASGAGRIVIDQQRRLAGTHVPERLPSLDAQVLVVLHVREAAGALLPRVPHHRCFAPCGFDSDPPSKHDIIDHQFPFYIPIDTVDLLADRDRTRLKL